MLNTLCKISLRTSLPSLRQIKLAISHSELNVKNKYILQVVTLACKYIVILLKKLLWVICLQY